MSILMVTGIEGARNCAEAVSGQIGMEVEVAETPKSALKLLRQRAFTAVVVDDSIAECNATAADTLWEHAGLAIPLQLNFAVSGLARVIREIRAALHRRQQEQRLAQKAASAALESELRSTVAGLLLHSELALSGSKDGPPLEERMRLVAGLAEDLRRQLAGPAVQQRSQREPVRVP